MDVDSIVPSDFGYEQEDEYRVEDFGIDCRHPTCDLEKCQKQRRRLCDLTLSNSVRRTLVSLVKTNVETFAAGKVELYCSRDEHPNDKPTSLSS